MIDRIRDLWLTRPAIFFAWLLVAVTLIRIGGLAISNLNLGPDEAQYWWWSRNFEFGYFSKPPFIAWMIGTTTAIFGNGEMAVRLSSPLAGAITGWFVFLTARRLYDERTALWAGVVWISIPILHLGSSIISTDTPLLMFWSIGLFAFARLSDTKSPLDGALMGAAIGFGMLSKYAMIYFPLGLAIAFAVSPRARQALKPVPLLIAAALAVLIFLPNVLWNAANDFQTLEHTQANAGWGGNLFHPDELAEFFFSQFFVVGPVLFGFLLFGLATLKRRLSAEHRGADLMLLGLGLPPLLIIIFQATISGANANWAMAAYPALIILVTAWMIRSGRRRLLIGSTAFNAGIGIIALFFVANFAIVDALGLSNAIKRVRDWPDQVAEIEAYAQGYPVVVVDDRELMGNILYYMRDSGIPVKSLDYNRRVEHHYEAFDKYDPSQYERALLVAKYPQYLYSVVELDTILEVGEVSRDMGVECPRRYFLFELRDYNPDKGPRDVPRPPEGLSRQIDGCRPY
ncbi:phospholipid carrier-dependent glycosyltransferase [Parvularcula flava]|uniref:Phospholipid carrier-dependent glycosyltransferase n=1 Tax=Aquisalinus luteolus TaxID=1566827 RepID=A0A8J3EV06_9PROT|nr:glycosyltransferase family 39 protein [Aquisalinus luteolus]NHK28584.1 phospholipid carrier-dependent glycosyltransferase [Aquisalinus luteolus]GGH98916.1 hypothetical protein GCM10011355_23640 [Aquisalinus luteolus]